MKTCVSKKRLQQLRQRLQKRSTARFIPRLTAEEIELVLAGKEAGRQASPTKGGGK